MARRNIRPSYISSAGPSRDASRTPAPGDDSDQENQDPRSRRMDKGKGKARAADSPSQESLPTPDSGDESDRRGQKRKRGRVNYAGQDIADEEEEDEFAEDEIRFNKYFDPNQNPEERRQIKRKSRALEKDFHERRDDYLRGSGNGLKQTIDEANAIFKDVKQTNDATLDSRLLVNVSGIAYKKTAKLVLGDSSTGIDVDEFLSKCITYMRNGGPLSRGDDETTGGPPNSRRRQRRRQREDDSDVEEDDNEPLDWEILGSNACFLYNSRPPVPTFLLGPLSVERKQRTQTQRRARQGRDNVQEKGPTALTEADLSRSDENQLTAICTRIRKQLADHLSRAELTISRAGFTADDLDTEEGRAMLKKCRVSETGGVPLFDFVLNPRSFAQTVENLFYVSFLIKEGSCGIGLDSEGLPSIDIAAQTSLDEQRRNKSMKHQAVFALDYATWQNLVKAFDVRESMIPHRQDEETATQVGQRGWYT